MLGHGTNGSSEGHIVQALLRASSDCLACSSRRVPEGKGIRSPRVSFDLVGKRGWTANGRPDPWHVLTLRRAH